MSAIYNGRKMFISDCCSISITIFRVEVEYKYIMIASATRHQIVTKDKENLNRNSVLKF